ncbi:MAG: hypothetical protein ACPGJU_03100 [Coraliomargarita sp.]
MIKRIASLFVALSVAIGTLAAQDVVVDQVKFNKTRDDWIQIEMRLTCNGNSAPDARNPKFLENIKVKPYIAYPKGDSADEFVYFTSEVEIIAMEQRDKKNVYFYVPGPIAKRDNLKYPKYVYIELSVNGMELPPQKGGIIGVSNLASLEQMKSMTLSGAEANKDMLLPVYYTQPQYLGSVRDLPVFLRRDPKP